ncbi:hypothetical protein B0H10DRAFT_326951 [Mycena sp. CBHHK59/15]|nr:hypothetical protein B0H10DRAFT_326951 [Mycena sp. CBHHK59/15]
MSQPPSYGGPPVNPDRRQLPPGWITQFDSNYNAWFYVNTLVQPPVTTWVHPLGAPASPAGPPPGAAYTPPPGGPPADPRGYGFPPQGQSPYPGAGYGNQSPYPPQQGGYSPGPGYQQPQYGGGYNQPPQQQWQAPPEQKGMLGGLFGHGRHCARARWRRPARGRAACGGV